MRLLCDDTRRPEYELFKAVQDCNLRYLLKYDPQYNHDGQCSSGGRGPTTKKIMPPGKTQGVLRLFCSFSKHIQNRRFCAEFGRKCVLKKEQKSPWPLSLLIFFVVFAGFGWQNVLKQRTKKIKKEQKRSWPLSLLIFLFFFVVFAGFGWHYVLKYRTKKIKKDHAVGKIARCPFSFLLLDPLAPVVFPDQSKYIHYFA